MENKKGSGIFLGVVSVATLVVAIVGATFAFFTAQAGSGEVAAESYKFATAMTLTKETHDPLTDGLIPLDGATYLKTAVTTGGTYMDGETEIKNQKCVDEKGYEVCQIYKATFNNTGSTDVTLNGKVTVDTNGFQENHLKLVQVADSLDAINATSAVELGTAETSKNLTSVTVQKGVEKVVYFVVYLEELDNENKNDQGVSFTGTISFEDATGSGGELTGTFGTTGA